MPATLKWWHQPMRPVYFICKTWTSNSYQYRSNKSLSHWMFLCPKGLVELVFNLLYLDGYPNSNPRKGKDLKNCCRSQGISEYLRNNYKNADLHDKDNRKKFKRRGMHAYQLFLCLVKRTSAANPIMIATFSTWRGKREVVKLYHAYRRLFIRILSLLVVEIIQEIFDITTRGSGIE